MLERIDPSPLHTLNRAVATAEASGPETALTLLSGLEPPAWLEGSYVWAAVLSDLCRRAGDTERAEMHRQRAIATAPTERVRELLIRRLATAPRSVAPGDRD
jgi:RNA polymerase sigma-70 factor (ECF subfamily)